MRSGCRNERLSACRLTLAVVEIRPGSCRNSAFEVEGEALHVQRIPFARTADTVCARGTRTQIFGSISRIRVKI